LRTPFLEFVAMIVRWPSRPRKALLTAAEAIAIAAAGFGAGTINAVVGSGTLITFPVLIGLGYAPVQANVSNTVGLVAGGFSGTHGYRAELGGQARRAAVLGVASVAGAIVGATLLLTLPASAFDAIVPAFIASALALIVLQPWLTRRLEMRRRRQRPHGGPWTAVALFAIGVYGGYFGAAQGILLLAVLGLSLAESLQRVNGLKNVLATLTNLVAALVFVVAADVDWGVAALIAAGSVAGGQVGARVGRRLPDAALRGLILVVGTAAIVKLTA
jgi:hypothetical protein